MISDEKTQSDLTYNIWTSRTAKGFIAPDAPREASKYRCQPSIDQGWTRGEEMQVQYCCLYFARGICHLGPNCNYLHKLPTIELEYSHRVNYQYDIFGRDRHSLKDFSTKGTGSFERDTTTLYIHYGTAGKLPMVELKELLDKNFGQWGPIDNLNLIYNKGIAFARYEWRSTAEFAKVAMQSQPLVGKGAPPDAVMDVRWALDDPNPKAIEALKRKREEAFIEAYKAATDRLDHNTRVVKKQELELLQGYHPGVLTSAYPNTEAQYIGGETQNGHHPDDDEEEEEEEDVEYDVDDIK